MLVGSLVTPSLPMNLHCREHAAVYAVPRTVAGSVRPLPKPRGSLKRCAVPPDERELPDARQERWKPAAEAVLPLLVEVSGWQVVGGWPVVATPAATGRRFAAHGEWGCCDVCVCVCVCVCGRISSELLLLLSGIITFPFIHTEGRIIYLFIALYNSSTFLKHPHSSSLVVQA